MRIITDELLKQYRAYLCQEEKSKATIEKYLCDLRKFQNYAIGQEVTKDDFLSEEVFNKLVKAKKIVEVTKASGKKASGKSDEPSSSTGAVDAGAEDTKPKSDSKDDSAKGGDAGDDAGDAQ